MRAPLIVRWLFAGVLVIAMTGFLTPRAAAAGEYTVSVKHADGTSETKAVVVRIGSSARVQ